MKCVRFVWTTVSDCRKQTEPADAENNLRKSHLIMCHVTKYSTILGVFQQPWPGVSPTAIMNEEKALGTRLFRWLWSGGSDELRPGHKRQYWRLNNRGVWPSWRHIEAGPGNSKESKEMAPSQMFTVQFLKKNRSKQWKNERYAACYEQFYQFYSMERLVSGGSKSAVTPAVDWWTHVQVSFIPRLHRLQRSFSRIDSSERWHCYPYWAIQWKL